MAHDRERYGKIEYVGEEKLKVDMWTRGRTRNVKNTK
jgi:hypothetical protein